MFPLCWGHATGQGKASSEEPGAALWDTGFPSLSNSQTFLPWECTAVFAVEVGER